MKGLWIKFKSSSNVGCDRKQEKTSKGKIGFLTFSSQFKLTVQSKISISILVHFILILQIFYCLKKCKISKITRVVQL